MIMLTPGEDDQEYWDTIVSPKGNAVKTGLSF